ncbi:MAG: hypothetical protein ACJAX5_000574 [Patiriisocius sp.]
MANSNMSPSQTIPDPHSKLKQTWVAQLLLLPILVLAAYAGVRDHYFVWDTLPFVLENPWIHEWSWSNAVSILTEAHRANWHPLVLFSHAIDLSLFGENSGAHHLMNMLYHTINTCLIYLLIYRLIRLLPREKMVDATQALWIAWITVIIFAIHPQHFESVAWVVERKDVLYTLLTLLIDIYPLKRIASVKQFVIGCAAKAPYWLVSGAVILITLAPVSGLIHVGPAKGTDHYGYLATLPFSLATALAIVYAWKYSKILQVPAATLTVVYLSFLLMTTQLQVSYWHNPLTLWTRVVTLHPDSAFGHRNLAAAYLQIDEPQLALQHAEKSLQALSK